MSADSKVLRITYHGGIIDHLGIQMYESPTAAVAELVANAWDADAETVRISLPTSVESGAELVISDNGDGMTFEECGAKFLNVGNGRRATDPKKRSEGRKRPLLGRKGIGKFAGFGIAEVIVVETTSKGTGERTSFKLDIKLLRAGAYVVEGGDIEVLTSEGPDEKRRAEHGTTIRLQSLKLGKTPSVEQFRTSLARRFLLHQGVADFAVLVNEQPLPENVRDGVQFEFPKDYAKGEAPAGLTIQADGWGEEPLGDGRLIRWRFYFYEDTIKEEELRGVTVFAHKKLAQSPFFFNLSGGLQGQLGQQYLSGQVEADFVDELSDDVITTERQRITWSHPEAQTLLEWGRGRVKELLLTWKLRRAEKKKEILKSKVANFEGRLSRLTKHEKKPVEAALTKLASIESMSEKEYVDMGSALLTSWESGRLQELIRDIASKDDFTAEDFVGLLAESQVLTALQLAEVARTKLEAIKGLRRIVEAREIENKIRDYIAERPWLIDPKWETFQRERSLGHILERAAAKAELSKEASGKRVDLALRSNEQLLVVEFMRPEEVADWDHLSRLERYYVNLRSSFASETALGVTRVSGLIVADKLDRTGEVAKKVESLRSVDINAYSWDSLLSEAEAKLGDFMDVLISREPTDPRLQALKAASPT